jgi:hypothetical protein
MRKGDSVGHLQKTTQLEVGELELEARFTDSKFNELSTTSIVSQPKAILPPGDIW